MRLLPFLFALTILVASEPVFVQSSFNHTEAGSPGWRPWAPRTDNAAHTFVDIAVSRGGLGSLAVSGNSNPAVLGGWEREIDGLIAGQWYSFVAYYRTTGIDSEARQVVARLDWRGTDGERVGRPDYAYRTEPSGSWTHVNLEAPAPPRATAVRLQLLLWDAPGGSVWWDEISLTPIAPPEPRNVRVAALNFRPRESSGAGTNVEKFVNVIRSALTEPVDVILLPEGITVVGTGKSYAEVAETLPGPTSRRLGEVAREMNAYIAAGLYEKEGAVLYNTAILLDRSGRLIGKYRKVYIPREETEGGITPGSDYPVFETEFGKVGMMICWDTQYADPARGLVLAGAEIILMPIWGGNRTLAKARAIENHVFLVSSGYDFPTQILDPNGEVLAIATKDGSAAIATIDLNKRYIDDWLGDMRARFHKELRLDVPVLRKDAGR